MKWKEVVTDYFTFTRRERIGILMALLLLIMIILSPLFFEEKNIIGINSPAIDTSWMTAIKKLEQKESNAENISYDDNEAANYQYDPSKTNNYNKPVGELFYFDPNSLSKQGWEKLGLRDKTIQTIQNYLSKGGHFKKPEDLQRVYGLRKNDYQRLAPFIRIKVESEGKTAEYFPGKNGSTEKHFPGSTSNHSISVEVNSADTSAFIALPGIGSKLAARIVNFRNKLGGFYSVEQIRETFGLPDSTFQKIKEKLVLKNNTIKKININTVTTEELKSHPYIKWNIANAITAFRKEHGAFSNTEDIKKIMIITDDIYKKMAPYLATQ